MQIEKKTRILIPHSWSPSVGDMALLSTTVRMLREVAPGAEITALVSHPEFTKEKLPEIDAKLEIWPWPIPVPGKTGILDRASYPFIYLSHFLSVIVHRLTKARIFLFNRKFSGPLSSFFDCDVVVSPGGDFISPKYGFITTLSEFMMAKMLGKKLIICAQTMGPFEGLLNGRLAAMVLNLADLIMVREHKTASLLKEIGVRDFHVTADVVFTFPPPKRSTKTKNMVIICAEKFSPESQRQRYVDYLRELTGRIMDEFGFEVVYMPANGADVEFQAEIASKIPGRVRTIGEVHPPAKVAQIISEADFFVSSRMHPIILGTLSATPFFSIGESFKFEEVLGALCEGCSISTSNLEDRGSMDVILKKIEEREKIRKLIAKRFPAVRKKAMGNVTLLSEKFREWQ